MYYEVGYWKNGCLHGYGRRYCHSITEEGLFENGVYRPNPKRIVSYDPKAEHPAISKFDLDLYIVPYDPESEKHLDVPGEKDKEIEELR